MAEIKQLQLGSQVYEFNGKYIQDENGNKKTYADIVSLINAASLPLTVVTALPDPSASTMGAIYLVKHEHTTGDTYDEYVTVKSTDETPVYSWEKIGNTDVDLTNYVQKGTTYTAAAQSNGAHTHTVTGTVSVPTITDTHKYLTASASGTALSTSTQSVLTGVKASATDEVLGAGTTFTVAGGALTGATAASKAADSFTANTPTVIDTTKFSGGSLTSGSVSGGTFSGASQAKWSASVSDTGVLSFSFTPNNTGTVSAISYTAPVLTPASLGTGFYTAGTAASFTEGTFTPNKVGSVSAISVTADTTKDKVVAVTGVAANGTASVIKTASISAQPTITLTAGTSSATGAIDFVSDVTTGTANASITNGTAASAGAHTHDINVAK